ncbi:MAG: hypothetical protein SOU05_00935 [Atopobium sp.]|uniref:hypothetical protein n=1 Tax=Atopobium sp. TaxID=1872650 RepID=UPI002A748A25|nr:hypothetical protein [Atopobium sp.]MDY2787961.1 hypothetical protein [Atopobium sp.]MDY4522429.1 hypothetical protein [Atopobium sp.]
MGSKKYVVTGCIVLAVTLGIAYQAPLQAFAQDTTNTISDEQSVSTSITTSSTDAYLVNTSTQEVTDASVAQAAPQLEQIHAYGWEKDEEGAWRFYTKEGKAVSGWLKSPFSGIWYYLDPTHDNTMIVGPFKDGTGMSYVADIPCLHRELLPLRHSKNIIFIQQVR